MKVFASILVCVLTACCARSGDSSALPRRVSEEVLEIGRIQHPLINESSGIILSRKDTNVFWTHNDGGGRKQVLYAMTRTGRDRKSTSLNSSHVALSCMPSSA